MSNVVQFDFKPRATTTAERLRRLTEIFARHRRFGEDVLWLKENAEWLNVLQSCGQDIPSEALDAYAPVYARLADRMAYFPQYYRFFLALALDLEDLADCGTLGTDLVAFAHTQGLVDAEMSDLQRAEARRLMLRRGVDPIRDPGLNDRLIAFSSRAGTFALPNKKAAYELTHIVFYLSEYGRVAPDLPNEVRASLYNAGTLAHLEMNADLLSEICVALRFGGWDVPPAWEAWLDAFVADICVLAQDGAPGPDGYHPYLVTGWHQALTKGTLFANDIPEGAADFLLPANTCQPLREVSQALMLDPARSADWEIMSRRLLAAVSRPVAQHISDVALVAPDFDAFFSAFARVSPFGIAPDLADRGFGA